MKAIALSFARPYAVKARFGPIAEAASKAPGASAFLFSDQPSRGRSRNGTNGGFRFAPGFSDFLRHANGIRVFASYSG